MKESLIRDKTFQFSIRVVKMCRYLQETKKEYIISKQVLRSGTSIGANTRESLNAESKLDFIHKLAIAQKEADETLYWLELLKETNYIEESSFLSMHDDGLQILKMIKSIIITTKKNLEKAK
jgi:four helix bundle protein